jgi:hypothetical protein
VSKGMRGHAAGRLAALARMGLIAASSVLKAPGLAQ